MNVGDSLRVFMIITGIVLMWATISSMAKQKLTENVCLAWGFVSVICVFAGILLRPYGINNMISRVGLVIIMVIAVSVLMAAFYVSMKLSELAKRNHELALQVSLLNHENYNMLERVKQLEKKLEQNEEQ